MPVHERARVERPDAPDGLEEALRRAFRQERRPEIRNERPPDEEPAGTGEMDPQRAGGLAPPCRIEAELGAAHRQALARGDQLIGDDVEPPLSLVAEEIVEWDVRAVHELQFIGEV